MVKFHDDWPIDVSHNQFIVIGIYIVIKKKLFPLPHYFTLKNKTFHPYITHATFLNNIY